MRLLKTHSHTSERRGRSLRQGEPGQGGHSHSSSGGHRGHTRSSAYGASSCSSLEDGGQGAGGGVDSGMDGDARRNGVAGTGGNRGQSRSGAYEDGSSNSSEDGGQGAPGGRDSGRGGHARRSGAAGTGGYGHPSSGTRGGHRRHAREGAFRAGSSSPSEADGKGPDVNVVSGKTQVVASLMEVASSAELLGRPWPLLMTT